MVSIEEARAIKGLAKGLYVFFQYQMSTCRTPGESQAMVQFEQLISNRYFLLAFIETLECQKSFNIRDKYVLGGLLHLWLFSQKADKTDILENVKRLSKKNSMSWPHFRILLAGFGSEKVIDVGFFFWGEYNMGFYIFFFTGLTWLRCWSLLWQEKWSIWQRYYYFCFFVSSTEVWHPNILSWCWDARKLLWRRCWPIGWPSACTII